MNIIKTILAGVVVMATVASNAHAYNNALSDTMIQFDIITGNDKDTPDENNQANNFYILSSGINQPNYSIIFNNTGFTFNLFGSGIANEPNTTFDGFRIRSTDNSYIFTDFSVLSNDAFNNKPIVSFDANNLYVNYNGFSYTPGSVVFSVKTAPAVPEPSSIALLLAGLGLIAVQRKRQQA